MLLARAPALQTRDSTQDKPLLLAHQDRDKSSPRPTYCAAIAPAGVECTNYLELSSSWQSIRAPIATIPLFEIGTIDMTPSENWPDRERTLRLIRELRACLNTLEQLPHDASDRDRVIATIPAYEFIQAIGMSLLPNGTGVGGRSRILAYLRNHPQCLIAGKELALISGISEWGRRIRELRIEKGWPIVSGYVAREMHIAGELNLDGVDFNSVRADDYVLLMDVRFPNATARWQTAEAIAAINCSTQDRLLRFLLAFPRQTVTGEELRCAAAGDPDWAELLRNLRVAHGWPIATRATGRPDISPGTYVLEGDRQSPAHDRQIADPIRKLALKRDQWTCVHCGWKLLAKSADDHRFLELHRAKPRNDLADGYHDHLETLCTICHDAVHMP
jgi:hypothetical protein